VPELTKTRARQVAEDVVTKDDAKHFATRADAAELRSELSRLEVRFYRALALQTVTIIGAVVGLLQLL
jgi:hypothetical protein